MSLLPPRNTFAVKVTVLVGAVVTAFLLTLYRPSPHGLIPFGVGQAEVRAAPGTSAAKNNKANYDLSSLKVFSNTLVKVRDNYVDPTRVDARGMLIAALESVQRNIAEVLVDARDDKSEVIVTVNDKVQTFNIADVDSVWKLAARLKEIFRFIQANMNPGSDPAQIEYAAVNGMLSTLDPHSQLLDPEQARDMDINTSGKFGGIGIVIGMRRDKKANTNRLTVINLIQGETPATRAGLKAGDRIVKINDEPTDNLTLNEAMNRLRGDPQTKVSVTVERPGVTVPAQVYELVRDIIHVPSVHARLLPGNVGYLKLDQFSQEVSSEMRRSMEELRRQGAKGWVLDLRNNPGGLLDQAVRVSDVFIDTGTLVTTVGYAGKQREEKRAQPAGTDHLPLAVLVNSNSASASEIVAGALKNLDRGVIVGQTTFGKGSVQVLFDYDDGSKLKLTIAQYLTPNDVSIQSVGITPDIELQRVFVPEKIASYKDILRLLKPINRWREVDLEAHLTSKNIHEGEKPADSVRFIEPEEKKKPETAEKDETPDDPSHAAAPDDDEEDDTPQEVGDNFKEDFQIRFARELVASGKATSRSELIKETKPFLAHRKAEEEAKIAAALGKLGIDWSVGPAQPGAHLVAHITTDKPSNKVTAGEVIAIQGSVTNNGTAPAYQVHARGKNDDWTFEGVELVFGRVDPGQTRNFTAYVKVATDAETRVDQVEWDFTEAGGAKVDAPVTMVAIDGLPRPQFAYTYQLIDDGGNGDGLLQLGESLRLHVTVKNVGKGPGLATSALLRNASGNGIVVNKGRFELQKLAAGESRSMDFTFDVKKDFTAKEAGLDLTVFDADLRENVNERLKFPVHAAAAGPVAQKGVVKVQRNVEVRSGAAEDAQVVGTAKRGAILPMTGKEGSWARIELEPGRPGFVPATAVAAAGGQVTASAFVPAWQVTPPTIAVNVTTHETPADHFQVQGSATDDNHLEDLYILVSNRDSKIEGKKVYYLSNRGRKSGNKLDFSANVPLWPGNNLITIVARESNEVHSVQNLFVLRNTKLVRTSAVETPAPKRP
jgi:carboxyl-terminal processing protease